MQAIGIKASIAEGRAPPKHPPLESTELLIINYEILKWWVPWLQKLKPKAIILDEVQYISNQTQRTKAVKRLCNGTHQILALSGTPLTNRPIELFTVLNLLVPAHFSSRWSYGMEFCSGKMTPWGWDFKGTSKPAKLHKLLTQTCMVRRRLPDVLQDLPQKIRQIIPIKLKDQVEYDEAATDFITWLQKQDTEKAKRAAKAAAMVRAGYLLRLVARLKLRQTVGWINEFLETTDKKIVIFAIHRKMIQALERRTKARSVIIDGSVTGRKRQAAITTFRTDKRVRVLIGNIKAAGTGVDKLQHAASDALFTEIPWRPGDLTQAEGRLFRIGQKDTVWCHYIIAKDTIEERLCKLVQKKQETLSAILDGGVVDGDLDIFDQLMGGLLK